MWQIIVFFAVVNLISSIITWFETKETSFKVSKINKRIYTFFGGAFGILLLSALTKRWEYRITTVILIIAENVGIYILLYELAIHVAD
jgi:uncharacterized membrane protein YsdA (DUF1294 family)|uniref:Uncharacterized protein n=1 Tax=Mesoaciditoga lauensis TaxID=1495039 RepID=A0A7V3RFJ3_9BACT